ncbi:interferon-induced protein 44-like [Triplophysa dalaica]|uniref:interferon-induced protein 44-like n=1 Tax=Triplophysa dalaica TaxID=1582913 RepID=UPI0024E02F8C|nr:interferon-induced protein 44-like [Triplophysa dalaica]
MASLTSCLTHELKQQLCALLGDVELTLLYKASDHEFDASAFHVRCDYQGPTLLVAYNCDGYIFGGYTSVEYAQSGRKIVDDKAFLFSFPFNGVRPVITIKVKRGKVARVDDSEGPNFGQQLYFCASDLPYLRDKGQTRNSSFSFDSATLYGDETELSECEVYKVTHRHVQNPWRNVLWTAAQKQELLKSIKNYKPPESSMIRVRILMIGPVGAGKSSFFNSINSIFMGRMTSKAMAGSSGTSLTTHFRTYPVKDGREGKPLPFVLCDTMGLEEQSGAGLDIEDISSILQGLIPDRYQFNPVASFLNPNEQKVIRPASLQERIHCVVYIMDTTKISLMSSKLEEKLAAIRIKVNSLGVPQIILMTKVDEACPLVEEDLQKVYVSSYIKTKVQEVSSRLGVPVSCVLPVKNYSQELELNLSCDVLLLTALQQMLNYAEDYLDDVSVIE